MQATEILDRAFDLFNMKLFYGQLTKCVILVHRHRGAHGYYHHKAFQEKKTGKVLHEIALTPETMQRKDKDIISTLVHEMCHLQHLTTGKKIPKNIAHHNSEWGKMMRKVGLIPSSTGLPGGKKTGTRVSHYIEEGGRFDTVYEEHWKPLKHQFEWCEAKGEPKEKKVRAKRKTFKCGCGVKATAEPETKLICGTCEEEMK